MKRRTPAWMRTLRGLGPRAAALSLLAGLSACGGGGPFGNSGTIENPAGSSSQKLSFVYFQRCVNPELKKPLTVTIGGLQAINSCAASGCHDNVTGTGGALRLLAGADTVDPGAAADALRSTEMYRNFYSSLGETVVGAPDQSRLLNKPLVRGVLHGGGLIFATTDDYSAKVIRYWISRPMPQGQDEFGSAAASMFAGDDPVNGACNVQ